MGGTIDIHVQSTPFAGEVDGASEFYETLGRLICLWSRFEQHITSDLLVILNLPGSESLPRPVPLAWNNKAKLWRRAFQQNRSLARYGEALRFIDDASDAAHDRNILLHSSWWGFTSSAPPTAEFRQILPKGEVIQFK